MINLETSGSCRTITLPIVLVHLMVLVPASGAEPAAIAERRNVSQPPSKAHALVASAEGHRRPDFQVFALHVSLPAITATNSHCLIVGGTLGLELPQSPSRAAQVVAVSRKLGVSVTLLDACLRKFEASAPAGLHESVDALRASLVDYRYLRQKWTQYHPPPGKESAKTLALSLLETGELEKAWALFNALPRPSPPAGLRTVR
jgi:hypothetical protein